ncbi:SDR family NAD(P)-dependent oxidoreductase [Streptomyces sp. NPDC001177]
MNARAKSPASAPDPSTSANARVVVITGAAGGIGRRLADRFLHEGDTVVATDTSRPALDKALAPWSDNPRLITAVADISRDQDVNDLADLIRRTVGRVDVLINCAGYFPHLPFEEMTPEQWRQVLDVNLTGTFLMTRAMLPLITKDGGGRIINFGSGSVFDGTAGFAHYVAAKAGVAGFTRTLAREVGRYGITANVIAPGLTTTPAVRETMSTEVLQAQRELRALHRDQEATDLVGPVFFLASQDAAFITGQILNVDGGAHMY